MQRGWVKELSTSSVTGRRGRAGRQVRPSAGRRWRRGRCSAVALHVLLLLLLLLLVAILRWRRGVGTAVRALVPRRGCHEEHGDGEGRLQHPNRLFVLPKWEGNEMK